MRDRLERLRGEAAAKEREREEKRKAREAAGHAPQAARSSGGTVRPSPGATRMKIVWAICDRNGDAVQQFPFPRKADAEAELARLNAASDRLNQHILQQLRVPLDA